MLNVKYTMDNEDGDTAIDRENQKFMLEENKTEDELQFAVSETFGVMFKTHKLKCSDLLTTLFKDYIPVYIKEDSAFHK